MNDKFFDLKKEKQDRMINASLKIFALNGYQHASTDDIVKEAGISKGLLFHYFISKLGLYSFLADYCVRYMILEMSTGVDRRETDYFTLLNEVEVSKLKASKNYPYMQQFLNSLYQEEDPEAQEATKDQRASLTDHYSKMMDRADTSRFRPEADVNRIGRMIHITLSGLMSESIRRGSYQPELFYTEAKQYLGMIHNMTYK